MPVRPAGGKDVAVAMSESQFAWMLFVVLVVVCATPYILYQCVKMSTFAAYRGKQLFDEWTQERNKHGRNQK